MHRIIIGAALLWAIPACCARAGELPGLLAQGSAATDARELADFGRLVGSWDLEVAWHHDDGRIEHRRGEWHFAWILEGRAIQDVWRVPGAGPGDPPRGYGTTIRAWDPELEAWRVTWVSGLGGGATSFIASALGGEIVMESQGEEEVFRWIFSDITPDSFHWRALGSTDGGSTWVVAQEMDARRRAPQSR
jgi:hypothetical protein